MSNEKELEQKNLADDVREAKPMTTEEALESCLRFVNGWFKNTNPDGTKKPYPRTTIPCDLNRDDDVRLMAHIKRTGNEMARLLDTIKELREALGHYAACGDGCTCGDGWDHKIAREALTRSEKREGGKT